MGAPRNSRLLRSWRWFTLGSGPLKRLSDRIQLAGRLVVLLSVLVSPPLAVAAATATAAHFEAVADTQAAERSEVLAHLLEDAPAAAPASDVHAGNASVRARAEWTSADGTVRQGAVVVAPRTPVGTAVVVWVDAQGDPTRAPLDRAAIPASAAAAGVLLLIGLPLGACFLHVLLCLALDAARERRWDRGWASVAPRWTSEMR